MRPHCHVRVSLLLLLLAILLQLLTSAVSAASGAAAAKPEAASEFFISNAATASPWLASGVYALNEGDYALQFCTHDDAVLAQGGMVFELLPVASTQASDVAAATRQADAVLHTFSSQRVVRESVVDGTVVALRGNGTSNNSSSSDPAYLYRVEFEGEGADCVNALLPIASAGKYMLFTEFTQEHVRVAFQDKANSDSNATVPVLQCITGCEIPDNAGWVSPVFASLLISLTSIVGVVILSFDKGRVEVIVEYMTSFGAGCLLGVVVFHLYPEGTGYLSDVGHWVMGACVLGGIVMSMSIEAGVHMMLASFGVDHCDDGHSHGHHPHHDHATMDHLPEKDRVTLSPESQSPRGHSHASHHIAVHVNEPSHSHHVSEHDHLMKSEHQGHSHQDHQGHSHSHNQQQHQKRQQTFWAKHIRPLLFVDPVAWITAVGDFFHAFTDGVVLAVAFKSCSSSLGWAVALGIVLHEVPHRVGDFFIFLKAGMTVPQALVVNFFASLASLLGVVVLLASGAVGRHTLGVLLAVGTGALLFIGLTELLPPMLAVRERSGILLHFFWFCLGGFVIGLSVLQDTHCHV